MLSGNKRKLEHMADPPNIIISQLQSQRYDHIFRSFILTYLGRSSPRTLLDLTSTCKYFHNFISEPEVLTSIDISCGKFNKYYSILSQLVAWSSSVWKNSLSVRLASYILGSIHFRFESFDDSFEYLNFYYNHKHTIYSWTSYNVIFLHTDSFVVNNQLMIDDNQLMNDDNHKLIINQPIIINAIFYCHDIQCNHVRVKLWYIDNHENLIDQVHITSILPDISISICQKFKLSNDHSTCIISNAGCTSDRSNRPNEFTLEWEPKFDVIQIFETHVVEPQFKIFEPLMLTPVDPDTDVNTDVDSDLDHDTDYNYL